MLLFLVDADEYARFQLTFEESLSVEEVTNGQSRCRCRPGLPYCFVDVPQCTHLRDPALATHGLRLHLSQDRLQRFHHDHRIAARCYQSRQHSFDGSLNLFEI